MKPLMVRVPASDMQKLEMLSSGVGVSTAVIVRVAVFELLARVEHRDINQAELVSRIAAARRREGRG
jgi:hypothetical protein